MQGLLINQEFGKRTFDLAGITQLCKQSTVSGMITATGQQFKDWSAAYRLSGDRMNDKNSFLSFVRMY
ncbi:MAG: hypothetical protein IPN72_05025 [Saprospiraceae bacterium]|nr:hypothetical protein [Saprospiraceae bacterium]